MPAGGFAVEERRVHGGVAGSVVQLRRQAQQHSPHLHLQPLERLHKRRVMREIVRPKPDLGEYLWHLAQQVECFTVRLLQVNPETVARQRRSRRPTAFLALVTALHVKREIFDIGIGSLPLQLL